MRWIGAGLIGLLSVSPLSLFAQQRSLDALRDSLSRNASVPELRQREVALARAAAGATPDLILERGLVMLRLYELTNENEDGDAARKLFETAIERLPDNGWAHYGLGLALAGGPGVRVPSPKGVLDGFVLGQSLAELVKRDPRSRASRQFLRALELDPSLTPAAVELANLAVESRNKDSLKQSREVLKKLVDSGRSEADLATALSRVEAALGNVDAAAAAAVAASSSPDASPVALLARAEALLRQPGQADAGAQAWFAGVAKVDEASLETFFKDVQSIASDRELKHWKEGALEAKRAWLSTFWDIRAASSGKTVSDRLSEHYERLATAQERYRRQGKRGVPPGGALVQEKYSSDQLPFDDRGLIYVRHGEPLEIVRTSNVDLRPNESWVYRLPTGANAMYHFVVLRDGTDFRLTDDIFNAVDPSTQGLPYEGVNRLFADRGAYDARYNILASRFDQIRNQAWAASAFNAVGNMDARNAASDGASSMLATIAELRNRLADQNREAAFNALESDSDRPDFTDELPFYYDVYTFKGNAATTDVTAAIAIPGSSLTPRETGGSFVYSIKVSLMVIDTIFGGVTRRDSTYNFRSSHRLGAGEHVRIHTQLASAASNTTVHRLVIQDMGKPGKGQMYGGGSPVPTYDVPKLLVSDIVLAEPDSGSWHRGDAHLALVPPRQFMDGAPLSLFYEIYNLPAETPYRTEISLLPTAESTGFGKLKKLFGSTDGSVRLRFDGAARLDSHQNVQELRRVATEMKPGRYKVVIKVTNLTDNQSATSETQFVVIAPKK